MISGVLVAVLEAADLTIRASNGLIHIIDTVILPR